MNKVILVVDDETELRKLLAAQLKREGFSVYTTASAEAAVDLLLSGVHVDALVTDMRMPGGMSGVQLVQKLEAEGVRLPVNILMSGHALLEKDEIEKFKFDYSLSKPFSGKDLAKILEDKLKIHSDSEAARREPRVPSEVFVKDESFHSKTSDLSLGGVFIKMATPFSVGSEFIVQIELEKTLQVKLVVKWTRDKPTQYKPAGIGCEFVDLPEEDRLLLQNHLESAQGGSLFESF